MGRSGPGRSRAQAGWVTCSPSSSPPPGSRSWTCSPSSAPESGCCPREHRTRTTRTTPGPSPLPHCARACSTWSGLMTTRSSCGCGPAGTASWPASAPRPPAGCTPRCARSPRRRPQVITATRADAILDSHSPVGPVAAAWHDLASEHLADLRRFDAQLRGVRKTITTAVRASGTTLTELFGVGPGDRRHHLRRRRRRLPVRQPGPVRRLQRHRADRGVLRQPEDLPAVPARQPRPEPCDPYRRCHPVQPRLPWMASPMRTCGGDDALGLRRHWYKIDLNARNS